MEASSYILFHVPVTIMGGAERGLLNVIASLGERVRVKIVVPGAGGALVDEIRARGLPFHVLELPGAVSRVGRSSRFRLLPAISSLIAYEARLCFFLRRERPDVIYTNGNKSHCLCGPPARLLGIPMICHVRDLLDRGVIIKWFLARFARIIIANSKATAERLEGLGPETRIVANVMDLEDWDRQRKQEGPCGVDLPERFILSVGKLTPLKGFDTVIRAFSTLGPEHSSVHLLIAGSEDYATESGYGDELRKLVRSLGLASRVRLLGDCSPVAPLFDRAELVVSASKSEGFGRVLMEAMASSKALVATSVGAVPELVEHGVEGLLVEPGDTGALARAVAYLLSDPGTRRRMGARGRERVEAGHTLRLLSSKMRPLIRAVSNAS